MDKGSLRRRMVRPVDAATAGGVVEALFSWMAGRLPGTVSAYLAMADEVDVEPLFSRLPGWRWVLPRIEGDATLTFRDRGVERERHRWGMTQPADVGESVPLHEIDVMLVPGIAFDRDGNRLGRGGGYYDRLLSGRRADCVAVGVTTVSQIIEAVPVEPYDQRVDYLVAEDGVIAARS